VTTLRANTDLVAGLWLSSLPGLNSGMVATRLPEKAEANQSLITSGFVVHKVVGGTPNMYVPERQPAIQITCYGFPVTPASRRPQAALASGLAEYIAAACYQTSNFNALLALPTGYPHARVQQAHLLSEPRPVYGDQAYWSVYQFDIQLYWIELP